MACRLLDAGAKAGRRDHVQHGADFLSNVSQLCQDYSWHMTLRETRG